MWTLFCLSSVITNGLDFREMSYREGIIVTSLPLVLLFLFLFLFLFLTFILTFILILFSILMLMLILLCSCSCSWCWSCPSLSCSYYCSCSYLFLFLILTFLFLLLMILFFTLAISVPVPVSCSCSYACSQYASCSCSCSFFRVFRRDELEDQAGAEGAPWEGGRAQGLGVLQRDSHHVSEICTYLYIPANLPDTNLITVRIVGIWSGCLCNVLSGKLSPALSQLQLFFEVVAQIGQMIQTPISRSRYFGGR